MALSNIPSSCLFQHQKLQQLPFFFMLLLTPAMSIFFNFPKFSDENITLVPDAYINAEGNIELTRNKATASSRGSVGCALYKERVLLWDNSTGRQTVTDFTTHFSFIILPLNDTMPGDGLAFFIAPFNLTIPTNNTVGENLGLLSGETTVTDSQNQTLTVEFDTCQNPWVNSLCTGRL